MQIPTIVFDDESLSKHTRSFDLVIGTERVIPYVQKNLSSFVTSETKYIVKDHGYPTARSLSNDTLEPIFDNSLNEERKLSMAIVGGGATIDYGKALVSLSRFRQRNITLILIPTNFGSAAELTPFATVWDFDKKVKQSVAMPFEFRRIAFYDDNALAGLNNLHAQIGFLDSVSHAFDSFISAESNSFLRNIALSNLTNCCSILSEFDYILEKFSPTKLQEISFYSGLCISQTKTSLTHGLSYWLTISHNIPHGIAVGLMLREVLDRHYFINELPHSLRKSLTESLLKIDFKSILGTRLVDANFDSFFAQIDLARVKNSTIKVGLDDLKSIFSSVVRSLEE